MHLAAIKPVMPAEATQGATRAGGRLANPADEPDQLVDLRAVLATFPNRGWVGPRATRARRPVSVGTTSGEQTPAHVRQFDDAVRSCGEGFDGSSAEPAYPGPGPIAILPPSTMTSVIDPLPSGTRQVLARKLEDRRHDQPDHDRVGDCDDALAGMPPTDQLQGFEHAFLRLVEPLAVRTDAFEGRRAIEIEGDWVEHRRLLRGHALPRAVVEVDGRPCTA